MTISPDEVLHELQQITSDLAAMDDEDPARADLVERQDRLRYSARMTHLALSGPAALESELKHLRRRLADFDRERVQIPRWQKEAGYFSDPTAAGREINRKLDEFNALDRATLERRAAEIEAMLEQDSDL